MRKIFLYVLCIGFLFCSCVTTKTYSTGYGMCNKEIVTTYNNTLCLDKGGIMCYFDRDIPQLPMPNVYLFDKNGKQYDTQICYDMLPSFAEHIIKYGKDSLSRSAIITTQVRNNDSKTFWRTNLSRFLKRQNIRLMDGSLLSKEKLPESEYYLFVDWVKDFVPPSMIQLDSICSTACERITLIKIHAYKLN